MNPTKLICDIGELNHLFKNSISIEHFLKQTVQMVAKHLKTDVCSIYVYDEDEKELVLKATEGLRPKVNEAVHLHLGQGLVGTALKELRVLNIENASSHPAYLTFSGIDEEKYDNFLAIPIARGVNRIGVLSLQRQQKHHFTANDEIACRAVASQLANIIENAKFLMSLHVPHDTKQKIQEKKKLERIQGRVASRGFAHSKAIVVDKDKTFRSLMDTKFENKYSLEDFNQAITNTETQLENLQKQVEEKLSDAASLIFASHLLILKDKEFVGTMAELINNGINAPDAVLKVAREYIDIFAASQNIYVKEKIQDVEDLTVRIISNLESEIEISTDINDKIVIAKEIFPSDLLKFSSQEIAGLILVSGGVTSHISILARSLRIPTVIAKEPELLNLESGTDIMLGAAEGTIYVNPSEEIVEKFKEHHSIRDILEQQKHKIKPETFTKDGVKITLLANVNLFSDAQLADELKCEGVGLYRTEFPFIIRNSFPSEEEQVVAYRRLVKIMAGKEMVIRTLDIGGDKVLSYYQNAKEQNPFLGMRSIRFCLQNKEVFSQQIRAVLRAGVGSELKIMFPMISSIDEFIDAREFVIKSMDELNKSGLPYNHNVKIGMMVELPAVVDLIEDFAQICDFFSIGTNDFIQFMLGVDRTNENVASFYLPYHPSVLRAIYKVTQAAKKYGRDISICGEMAHDEQYLRFLIGAGIRKLSVDPAYLLAIQEKVLKIDCTEAIGHAHKLMELSKLSDIRQVLEDQQQ